MNKPKKVTPANATPNELLMLSHDNVCVGDFSIMIQGSKKVHVWLSEHPRGKEQKQAFEIPRTVFNKLIKWYWEGVVPREDVRSR